MRSTARRGRGEVTLPIRTAQLIPARKTGPDFRLDNRSRLHSLTGADPALLHRALVRPGGFERRNHP